MSASRSVFYNGSKRGSAGQIGEGGMSGVTKGEASEPVDHLAQAHALTRELEARSGERRELGAAFAKAHLMECCVELATQRASNTLAQGKMQQLREIIGSDDIYQAQRLVEALAVEFIAAQGRA